MCWCIYIYIYIYIYVDVCVCVYMYLYTHVYITCLTSVIVSSRVSIDIINSILYYNLV